MREAVSASSFSSRHLGVLCGCFFPARLKRSLHAAHMFGESEICLISIRTLSHREEASTRRSELGTQEAQQGNQENDKNE